MAAFFRTHWLTLVVGLVCTLVTLGTAAYLSHSAAQAHRATLARMGAELKAAGEAADKSRQESERAALAAAKDKAACAALQSKLTQSEKALADAHASMETMSQALARASKSKEVQAKAVAGKRPPVAAPKCKKEVDTRAAMEQQRQLQSLQADAYRRDAELTEKQKELDQARSDLADAQRKLDREKAEYHWPHGQQTK